MEHHSEERFKGASTRIKEQATRRRFNSCHSDTTPPLPPVRLRLYGPREAICGPRGDLIFGPRAATFPVSRWRWCRIITITHLDGNFQVIVIEIRYVHLDDRRTTEGANKSTSAHILHHLSFAPLNTELHVLGCLEYFAFLTPLKNGTD